MGCQFSKSDQKKYKENEKRPDQRANETSKNNIHTNKQNENTQGSNANQYEKQRQNQTYNRQSGVKQSQQNGKPNNTTVQNSRQSGNSTTKINEIAGNNLKIITLNYSGIILSPFQFFPNQNDKEYIGLSQMFQKLLKQQLQQQDKKITDLKKQFKWNVGSIDKNIQRQRYAPVYNPHAGIRNHTFGQLLENVQQDQSTCNFLCMPDKSKQNKSTKNLKQKSLQTYQQFKQSWRKTFKPFKQNYSSEKTQIEEMLKFDLLCYKTILRYVYKSQFNLRVSEIKVQKNTKNTTDEQLIRSLDCSKYEQFINKFFNKAFINQQRKISKTIEKIKQIQADVIFLQQTTEQLKMNFRKHLKSLYHLQQCDGESVILLNRKRFGFQQSSIALRNRIQVIQRINWNEDSLCVKIGRCLFICAHLSSKAEKNTEQKMKMISDVQELVKSYPDFIIVLAGDMNSFVEQIPQNFQTYPTSSLMCTTIKKRTLMQPQVNKAGVIIKECKDQIICNKNLYNRNIWTIQRQLSEQNQYLPTQDHPYDHFVVYAQVQIPKIDKNIKMTSFS